MNVITKNVENMNLSLTLKKFGHIQVKSGDNYRIITDVVYRAQLPIPPPALGQQNNNRSEETYTGCSVNLKKCFGKQKRSVRVLEENQTIKHCTDRE